MRSGMVVPLKEAVLATTVVAILALIWRFERRWRGRQYYCTTLMTLRQRETTAAFAVLFGATIVATAGTFFLGTGQEALMRLLFDLTLVLWAVFFLLLNHVIAGGDRLWSGSGS